MLELNQILRANEINFAVLAAVPAFLGVFLIGWLLKRPFTKVGFVLDGHQLSLDFLEMVLKS